MFHTPTHKSSTAGQSTPGRQDLIDLAEAQARRDAEVARRTARRIRQGAYPATPLPAGHLCADCRGTGAKDGLRNADGSWPACWTCNGNGLDPAAYFRSSR